MSNLLDTVDGPVTWVARGLVGGWDFGCNFGSTFSDMRLPTNSHNGGNYHISEGLENLHVEGQGLG